MLHDNMFVSEFFYLYTGSVEKDWKHMQVKEQATHIVKKNRNKH